MVLKCLGNVKCKNVFSVMKGSGFRCSKFVEILLFRYSPLEGARARTARLKPSCFSTPHTLSLDYLDKSFILKTN